LTFDLSFFFVFIISCVRYSDPLSYLYLFHLLFLHTTHYCITMAASKFLVALVLLLAVTGSMGQAMDPAAQKIVAACGVPAALKIQGLAPKCAKDIAKAKACPASCKSLIAGIPSPACGAAVNSVSPKATQTKITAVSTH
jgi:hypothetical protein